MDNQTSTATATITPKATAFDVDINIDKSVVDNRFNAHWAKIKDRLPPDIIKKASKGGYRELKRERVEKVVGKNELYRQVLAQVVTEFLETQPREALAINEVVLQEGIQTDTIKASVYLEPTVTWNVPVPGVDAPLKVTILKHKDGYLDALVQSELEAAQRRYAILKPEPEDTTVAVGHVVALDCNAVVDGVQFSRGSFTNNKWLIDESQFKIHGIVDQLVGLKAGESKKVSIVYPDNYGEQSGKAADLMFRINEIFKGETPPIDNDLAISAGRTDLETWKTELRTRFSGMIAEDRKNAIFITAMQQLINPDVVSMDPIPQAWIVAKANMTYATNRDLCQTEEELVSKFAQAKTHDGNNVSTKQDLLVFFGEKAAEQLVTDLILRSWGKKKGVEGDAKLSTLSAYADAVRDAIIACAEVEEVEMPNNANAEQ